jgi:hypothetical protein
VPWALMKSSEYWRQARPTMTGTKDLRKYNGGSAEVPRDSGTCWKQAERSPGARSAALAHCVLCVSEAGYSD